MHKAQDAVQIALIADHGNRDDSQSVDNEDNRDETAEEVE